MQPEAPALSKSRKLPAREPGQQRVFAAIGSSDIELQALLAARAAGTQQQAGQAAGGSCRLGKGWQQ